MQDHDYANRLGDQLEIILGDGADELEEIVDRLNQSDIRPPAAANWTPDNFIHELRRLGG